MPLSELDKRRLTKTLEEAAVELEEAAASNNEEHIHNDESYRETLIEELSRFQEAFNAIRAGSKYAEEQVKECLSSPGRINQAYSDILWFINCSTEWTDWKAANLAHTTAVAYQRRLQP